MKNAVKLFLREWKYLLKRPRSLVLMVLVPILVTCICGSGYGKGYFSDLKMGVVDYSYTKQTREVVEAFRQSPYFDVVGYYNDEDEIAEAMRVGEIVGCLIFPADFTRKMQLGQQAEVLLGSSQYGLWQYHQPQGLGGSGDGFHPDCREKPCGKGQNRGGCPRGHEPRQLLYPSVV